MRLVVVSGFLGSGKTTLVMALARDLAARGYRSCYVVNEAGEVGVDPAVLRDCGLRVWEIAAGCICCQLGADLVSTLAEISSAYEPAVIVVEASGVATPSGITTALQSYHAPSFASRCMVTVVDPTRLHLLLEVMTPLAEAQIREADEVMITKLDVASRAEVAEAVEVVSRLNPGACVWTTDRDGGPQAEAALAHLGHPDGS